MRYLGVLILMLMGSISFAQERETFTLEEYLNWIRAFHPVVQQANLLEDEARFNLLKARGGFDPKWMGDYEAKSFNTKNYFQIGKAGLKIPTWVGADVEVSYNWANGVFLNPEQNLPINGQAAIKVEVPVLQGLLFDDRRAQVQQARLYRDANEQEQRIIINDLLLAAYENYWQWTYQTEVVKIQQEALDLATLRFETTKSSFIQGDKPAIDTLESFIQVQNRQLALQEAKIALQNVRLQLSNFLWLDQQTPLEVTEALQPLPLEELQNELNSSSTNLNTHPLLQQLAIKQQQLDIKERLKREYLKPNLRLSYNFLGTGFNFLSEKTESPELATLFTENYKWGITFDYPLLLRKERAALELVQVEQLQLGYKQLAKQTELQIKLDQFTQQLEQTRQQLQLQTEVISNYQQLLDAENIKFQIGESSIFLLNSREQKLIAAQKKILQLQLKIIQLKTKLKWVSGELS